MLPRRASVLSAAILAACGAAFAACGSSDDEVNGTRHDASFDHKSENGFGAFGGFEAGGSGADAQPDTDTGTSGMAGAGGTAGGGGSPVDASQDAQPDTAGDAAAADVPVSTFCGDGIRDPVAEECDDGTGVTPPDACASDCRIEDVLVLPGPGSDGGLPPYQMRTLAHGRHPVAAGPAGFAVAMVDTSMSPYVIRLRAFTENGTPGTTLVVTSDPLTISEADPVVAALPNGKYAVAYADLDADGDGRGVALKIVDPTAATVGPLVRVNTTTFGVQDQPDTIWTGSEVVVAFTDQSKSGNFRDVKMRRFDAAGQAKSGEETIAATSANEGNVALAPFAGSWAIAYRFANSAVTEKVVVRAGTSEWSTEVYAFGPAGDRPGLVELDPTHLLLVYTIFGGSGITARLRGMVIDTSSSAAPTSFEILPLVEPYASDASLDQLQANVVAAGGKWFVAWRSEAVIATVEQEELWLKQLSWSSGGTSSTLDLSVPEIPLPRYKAHRAGEQSLPALASSSLGPSGAIVSAWEDRGRVFGAIEGTEDIVAELIPVPVVRLPGEGGLE